MKVLGPAVATWALFGWPTKSPSQRRIQDPQNVRHFAANFSPAVWSCLCTNWFAQCLETPGQRSRPGQCNGSNEKGKMRRLLLLRTQRGPGCCLPSHPILVSFTYNKITIHWYICYIGKRLGYEVKRRLSVSKVKPRIKNTCPFPSSIPCPDLVWWLETMASGTEEEPRMSLGKRKEQGDFVWVTPSLSTVSLYYSVNKDKIRNYGTVW